MFALDEDRRGDVPHRLAGVARIDLAQDLVAVLAGVARRGQARGVVEDALGAVPFLVVNRIAGQVLGVERVVGGQVAVAIDQHGEHHHVVLGQKGVLDLEDAIIKVAVVIGVKLGDLRVGQRPGGDFFVVGVENLLAAQLAAVDGVLEDALHGTGANDCQGARLGQQLSLQHLGALLDEEIGEQAHDNGQNNDQRDADLHRNPIRDPTKHCNPLGAFQANMNISQFVSG